MSSQSEQKMYRSAMNTVITTSTPFVDLHRYWNGANDEFSNRRTIWLLDDYIDWLDGCKNIVDLGCGTGRMVKRFLNEGRKAQGITYQIEEVEYGRDKLGLQNELVYGDLHSLPWNQPTFDGMLMWDVLEHCLAPLVVLKEARKCMLPGARGLIFIPSWKNWGECKYHILVPTQEQMKHLLNLSGWRLDDLVDLRDADPEGPRPDMAVYKVSNT